MGTDTWRMDVASSGLALLCRVFFLPLGSSYCYCCPCRSLLSALEFLSVLSAVSISVLEFSISFSHIRYAFLRISDLSLL